MPQHKSAIDNSSYYAVILIITQSVFTLSIATCSISLLSAGRYYLAKVLQPVVIIQLE